MIFDEKLLFEAVRYALEEMTPPERDAFEERLADDQDAREALAVAVKLCETVTATLDEMAENAENMANRRPREYFDRSFAVNDSHLATHVERRWRRRAAWTAMALAASVLIAVMVAGIGRERGPNLASPSTDVDRQLAVVWANSPAITELSDVGDAADDANSVNAVLDSTEPDENDGPSSDLVPTDRTDWLLEALTASQRHEQLFPPHAATRGEG